MPIRIMHVLEALGVGGGVETGVSNLVKRMDPNRFEHVICAVSRIGPYIDRFRVMHVVQLRQQGTSIPVQVGPLARAIREVQPDIVHSRNWGALEAVIAGRWARSCSVVHSEHGVEIDLSREPLRRTWFRRVAFELADRVMSVSYHLRSCLAEVTGFSAHKIDVIHNGVDTRRFRPDFGARNRCRAAIGLADEDFCIGCVGRLSEIKDYPTMLRAVEILCRSCRSWRLLIVGEGPERRLLEEMISANADLQSRVHLLGNHDRVQEFLSAIDVYVLPSVREGISNSLLEAMAAGLPIVVTQTGGNPEVVTDGESGLLFPVADVDRLAELLLLLYRKPELRERLGREARQRVEQEFSLDTMVRRYEQMYSTLREARAA
jgi:sugar transferase (PEP-CTERM/EpsH1 system associated)